MEDFEKNTNIESDDSYEFVTETIKKKPINVKKIVKKIMFTIFLAIVFAVVSCVTLILLYPRLKDKIAPEDYTKPVTLPVAQEVVVEDPIEEFVPPEGDDSEEYTDINGEKSEPVSAEPKEDVSDDIAIENDNLITGEEPKEDDLEENHEKEVIINQIVEKKDLELEDYRILLRKMSSIAANTQKCLVTVSGKTSDTDWFNNSYVNNNLSTGVILADNGKDLLIVSPTNILHDAATVDVTFCDGQTYPATVRKSDANTGLSIVAVVLNLLSEETLSRIEMAQFGSLATSSVGAPVVAVGSPYGVSGSIGTGQIISNSKVVDKVDRNIRILSTDIYGSPNASGVLVNFNGRIVGIICHEDITSDMPNLINAYAISDITDSIEKISNGQNLAYFGIIGADVTKDIHEQHDIPYGTYVREVVPDSPAMNVGIRNGDVIVKIGNSEIESLYYYKIAMLSAHPGDIVNVTIQRPRADGYTELTYEVTLEELK